MHAYDDDVCLLQLPIADPFEALANSGAVYMYGLLKEESHEETRATLTPWLKAYAREHNLAAAAVDADSIYFTNFFVSRVDFWTRPNVTEYLAAVDISRSIFTHRWGDAPLQTAALRLHAAPEAIHHLRMDYLHMSTRDYIVDGRAVPFHYHPQSIEPSRPERAFQSAPSIGSERHAARARIHAAYAYDIGSDGFDDGGLDLLTPLARRHGLRRLRPAVPFTASYVVNVVLLVPGERLCV